MAHLFTYRMVKSLAQSSIRLAQAIVIFCIIFSLVWGNVSTVKAADLASAAMPQASVELSNQPPAAATSRQTDASRSVQVSSSLAATQSGATSGAVYLVTKKEVARSRDFYSSSPHWENIANNLPPEGSSSYYKMVVDPFDPIHRAWIVRYYAATGETRRSSIWVTDYLDDPLPNWRIAFATNPSDPNSAPCGISHAQIINLEASPVQQNLIYAAMKCGTGTGEMYVGKSEDGGQTWSWSTNYVHAPGTPGFEVSSHQANRLWVGTTVKLNNKDYPYVQVSENGGSTFHTVGGPGKDDSNVPPQDVHVPAEGNKADSLIYTVIPYKGKYELYRSMDGGNTSWITVTARINGIPYYPSTIPGTIGTNPEDNQQIFYTSGVSDCGTTCFLYSSDGGISWEKRYSTTTLLDAVWSSPFETDSLLAPRRSSSSSSLSVAWYSADGGWTWTNKTGDWESIFHTYSGSSNDGSATIVDTGDMLAALADSTLECFDETALQATGYEAGSINTSSGVYDYSSSDFSFPTVAGEMAFRRTYSTAVADVFTTTLGYGWTHNLDSRLIFTDTVSGLPGAVFKATSANRYQFAKNSDGTFKAYAGICASLTRQLGTPATYLIKDKTQRAYHFDAQGQLQRYIDPQGHAWYYFYSGGKLTYVSDTNRPDPQNDPLARYIHLLYEATGHPQRLTRVMDHRGRQVSFDYDGNNNLTSITDVMGQTWNYDYQNTDFPHLLTQVSNPLSQTVERTVFDESGRAIRQYNGLDELVAELDYRSYGTTVISKTVDGQVYTSTHTYDVHRTLTGLRNAQANATYRSYDLNFRLQAITDPLNHTTNMAWSADGLDLQQVEDAAGNITTLSYDSLHNLTRTMDGRGYATNYTYSGTLLNRSADALGNTTVYTYTTANLLEAMEDPNHNLTTYQYDSYGQRIAMTENGALTTRYGYDDLGRPITVTLPGGRTNWTCYDDTGRVVRTVGNASGDGSSSQSDPCDRENYVRSLDPLFDQINETIYDAAGRNIASIQWVLDDGQEISRTVRTYYDDSGRPVRVVYNLTGWDIENSTPPPQSLFTAGANLTSQTVYGVGGQVIASIEWLVEGTAVTSHTTRTFYDSLGRPVTTTLNFTGNLQDDEPPAYNPLYPDRNVSTYTTYDAAGNVIITTDALGRRTRTYYDELNRPVLVFQGWDEQADDPGDCHRYEGAESNICSETKYDANGNVIATRDARGVITRTYYDALDRPVLALRNAAQVWNNIGEQDAPPPSIQFGNNANVATGTFYAGSRAIANVEWLVVGSQVISHTTRAYYDDQGRPYLTVRNLDPNHNVYDDEPPTCNRDASGLEDPYNICTETKYDAETGRAIASLDPLGRVTRTYYDALERPYLVVRNLTVQAYTLDTPPDESAFGNDHDVAAQTIYDERGQAIASVEWWEENGEALSRTTRTYFDFLGRTTSAVQNFVGDLQDDDLPAYDPAYPDRNVRIDAVYASDGRLIASIEWLADASGDVFTRTARTYYDALGRATSLVQNLNPAWGYRNPTPPTCNRDQTGLVEPYNVCQETVYNAAGQVTQRKDALGKSILYQYNALGQLSNQIDPLSQGEEYSYDANGNRTSVTDAGDVVTRFEYDDMDRLAGVIENYLPPYNPGDQANVYTRYGYNALGYRLVITDALTHTMTFAYDPLGRLVSESDALGHTWQYGYEVAGNRVQMVDANEFTTTYTYDGLSRLAGIDYPDPDADVAFSYNALSWRTVMTDGLGVTAWAYDGLGQPITITQPVSGTVGYRYDAQGNRTKLIYPDGKQVAYAYDTLDRLARVTDWASRNVTYTHDVAGDLIRTDLPTNEMGSERTYNDAGQLLSLDHSSVGQMLSSFVYAYDPVGNRTAVTETTVVTPSVSFADGFESGNLSAWDGSVTDGGDLRASTEATLVGSYGLEAEIDDINSIYVFDDRPDAAVYYRAHFSFDSNSLLMLEGDVFTLFQGYDANGTSVVKVEVIYSGSGMLQLKASARDNSASWVSGSDRAFLNMGSINSIDIEWAAGSPGKLSLWVNDWLIMGYPVTVNNSTRRIDSVRLGAVEGIDNSTRGTYFLDAFESEFANSQRTRIEYAYDPLNRLTEADYSDGMYYHYSHDAVGNRLSEMTPVGTTNYVYDDANRLTSVGVLTYTWDANGNLLSDGVATYTYDHANRLIALNGHGPRASFAYNGLGDRVEQTLITLPTHYTLDLASGLTQVLADNRDHTYLYGLGRISQHSTSQTEYFLGDALGSLRQLVDVNGQVTLAKSYTPYGETLSSVGSGWSMFAFTGEALDNSGLVYLRARYYAPGQGRFISRDVWEGDYEQPMSYNGWLYSYANPARYVDRNGHWALDVSFYAGPVEGGDRTDTDTRRRLWAVKEVGDTWSSFFTALRVSPLALGYRGNWGEEAPERVDLTKIVDPLIVSTAEKVGIGRTYRDPSFMKIVEVGKDAGMPLSSINCYPTAISCVTDKCLYAGSANNTAFDDFIRDYTDNLSNGQDLRYGDLFRIGSGDKDSWNVHIGMIVLQNRMGDKVWTFNGFPFWDTWGPGYRIELLSKVPGHTGGIIQGRKSDPTGFYRMKGDVTPEMVRKFWEEIDAEFFNGP